jgi:hypothetical protein
MCHNRLLILRYSQVSIIFIWILAYMHAYTNGVTAVEKCSVYVGSCNKYTAFLVCMCMSIFQNVFSSYTHVCARVGYFHGSMDSLVFAHTTNK